MDKNIDMNMSVREICKLHPEIKEVLASVGFDKILNPVMLNTAGRFMTIPKGAAMKGLDLDEIKQKLADKGYILKETDNVGNDTKQ